MKRIRVLIVDDSATIRHLLCEILSRDPQIEVVGQAPEPAVARKMIKDLNPDVITLDIEMPNMNGLEFLEKIMRLRPMPVVMISTLTERGAEVTLDALAMGAVDYFPKPTRNVAALLHDAADNLVEKVKIAAASHVRPLSRLQQQPAPLPHSQRFANKLIAIGSSTGGVEALLQVLTHFPENCPPTVVTQPLPAARRQPGVLPAADRNPGGTATVLGFLCAAGDVDQRPGGVRDRHPVRSRIRRDGHHRR